MLKLLDGNKRLIVVVGFIVSGIVAMVTGQDAGAYLDLLLRALGWGDPALISGAQEIATRVVPLLFAVWAAGSALWKMWRQRKAGASLSEINSLAGYVKLAAQDGTPRTVEPSPATLYIEGSGSVVARPASHWKE